MEYVNNNTHHHFYIQTAQYITPNITANTIPINYIVGCLSCPSQLVMKALAQTKFCTEMSSITSRHKEIQNLTNQTNTLSYSHTMTMHSARWHWLYSSEAVLQLWWSIAHCAKRGDRKFISEFLPHVYDFAVYGVGLFVSIVQLLNVYNYTSARKYRALPTSRTYMAFPLTPVCYCKYPCAKS